MVLTNLTISYGKKIQGQTVRCFVWIKVDVKTYGLKK